MRRSTAKAQVQVMQARSIPRGWIVLGLAMMSWMLVVTLWSVASQLFGAVVSVL